MKIKIFLILLITNFCCAQIVNIPDTEFKNFLRYSSAQNLRAKDLAGNYFAIDANADGQIQVTEAAQVSYIKIAENSTYNINSFEGINQFPNLNYFSCTNQSVIGLNIHGLNNLELINLNYCSFGSPILYDLPQLKTLSLWYDNLLTIDVSNIPSLTSLNVYQNNLTELDVSMLPNLVTLSCNNNQLVSLNMKNGKSQTLQNGITQGYFGSPTLRFVCVDDTELDYIQTEVSYSEGAALVVINDYCTFVPGGPYYTVNGTSKVDFNNNGCDQNDSAFPNLKFLVSNGTTSGSFYANQSGNFSYNVQLGTHTISPIFENPNYFTVSPGSISVAFPAQTSPIVQNFCIVPNGNHNDLEISIIPTNTARPGFNSNYKIIYKNKGTTTQSGTVALTYDENKLDFISTNTNSTAQSDGNLTWTFTNLHPFETKEIAVVLNLNSPTDTPPLNSGETLIYTANITALLDESPLDNQFILNQAVVNSFDPNDKTCLEGTTITPNLIGKYVHYIIRFENNGTANAENIVVKDIIDSSKFDINSLVAISASHSFQTRVRDNNKVEFIFENINLPFNDANNDGYIAFKLRTKSNLAVGNSFSNSASIFFDYNFPIITNNYTTTIQNLLGLQTNDLNSSNVVLYPNPIKDILNFKTDENIYKIEVYDLTGKIISSNAILNFKIDLGELKAGNYIIKVFTEKKTFSLKILKI